MLQENAVITYNLYILPFTYSKLAVFHHINGLLISAIITILLLLRMEMVDNIKNTIILINCKQEVGPSQTVLLKMFKPNF